MTNTTAIKAKVMIGMVAAASLCGLSFGAARWNRKPGTVGAPVGGSRTELSLQVKLPGMTSSMSGNLPVFFWESRNGIVRQPAGPMTAAVAQSYTSGKNH